MKTYPLAQMSLDMAMNTQFRLMDAIHRHFTGTEFLQSGDVGLQKPLGRPVYTHKVEQTLADFFGAESALLVRGAGTGAIRLALEAVVRPGDKLLVHDAPIYPTTEHTIGCLGLTPVCIDYNELSGQALAALPDGIVAALVQVSRQKPDDRYDLAQVIRAIRGRYPEIVILTDDNYAALKTEKLGVGHGADISTFSLFKMLGPEGVGLLVGREKWLQKIAATQYSGGSKVQGPEAMEALRALVYVPVMQAIQSQQIDALVDRLNRGEVSGVEKAVRSNSQSANALVFFKKPVAKLVVEEADALGAATCPVGAESKYELTAMVYRVSGTFLKDDPSLGDYAVRVNPMRTGAETVIRLLQTILQRLEARNIDVS